MSVYNEADWEEVITQSYGFVAFMLAWGLIPMINIPIGRWVHETITNEGLLHRQLEISTHVEGLPLWGVLLGLSQIPWQVAFWFVVVAIISRRRLSQARSAFPRLTTRLDYLFGVGIPVFLGSYFLGYFGHAYPKFLLTIPIAFICFGLVEMVLIRIWNISHIGQMTGGDSRAAWLRFLRNETLALLLVSVVVTFAVSLPYNPDWRLEVAGITWFLLYLIDSWRMHRRRGKALTVVFQLSRDVQDAVIAGICSKALARRTLMILYARIVGLTVPTSYVVAKIVCPNGAVKDSVGIFDADAAFGQYTTAVRGMDLNTPAVLDTNVGNLTPENHAIRVYAYEDWAPSLRHQPFSTALGQSLESALRSINGTDVTPIEFAGTGREILCTVQRPLQPNRLFTELLESAGSGRVDLCVIAVRVFDKAGAASLPDEVRAEVERLTVSVTRRLCAAESLSRYSVCPVALDFGKSAVIVSGLKVERSANLFHEIAILIEEMDLYVLTETSVGAVSAKFGIAFYPLDGSTFGDLLKNADESIYGKVAPHDPWLRIMVQLDRVPQGDPEFLSIVTVDGWMLTSGGGAGERLMSHLTSFEGEGGDLSKVLIVPDSIVAGQVDLEFLKAAGGRGVQFGVSSSGVGESPLYESHCRYVVIPQTIRNNVIWHAVREVAHRENLEILTV